MGASTALSIAASLYVIVSGLYALYLWTQNERWLRVARLGLSGALLGHLAAACYCAGAGDFSWTRGWPVLLVGLPVAILRLLPVLWQRVALGGAFAAPVAAVVLYAAALSGHAVMAADATVPTSLALVHIGASGLGFLGLTTSFVLACLYLVQEQQLRHRPFMPLVRRLPPLERLERHMFRALGVGFGLFTLGAILGAVWLLQLRPEWSPEPQHVLAFVSWGVFGILVGLRLVTGWSGRRAAMLLALGYLGTVAVVMLYYFRAPR